MRLGAPKRPQKSSLTTKPKLTNIVYERKFRRFFRVTNSREEMPIRSRREQMWIRRDVKEIRCGLEEICKRTDVD